MCFFSVGVDEVLENMFFWFLKSFEVSDCTEQKLKKYVITRERINKLDNGKYEIKSLVAELNKSNFN